MVIVSNALVAPGSAFGAGGEGYVRLCFAQSPARLERALGRLVAGIGQFAGSPAARSAA